MSNKYQTISVVIPVFNCGKPLLNALASVKWANEIIIVDMFSTDDTIKVYKKYNAKIYKRSPKNGNFDENRKFGMEKASGDWILKLDSDEVLSSLLQKEIQDFLSGEDNKEINGYHFYNKIFMFGKEVKHGFVKPGSNELRLFRNGKWHYDPYRFHQQITVDGAAEFFKNVYYHYNYANVSEFIEKTNKYTSLDAKILAKEITISPFEIFISPVKTFIKLFIFQLGFLDGTFGIETCMLFSLYYLIEKIKIWEIQMDSGLRPE